MCCYLWSVFFLERFFISTVLSLYLHSVITSLYWSCIVSSAIRTLHYIQIAFTSMRDSEITMHASHCYHLYCLMFTFITWCQKCTELLLMPYEDVLMLLPHIEEFTWQRSWWFCETSTEKCMYLWLGLVTTLTVIWADIRVCYETTRVVANVFVMQHWNLKDYNFKETFYSNQDWNKLLATDSEIQMFRCIVSWLYMLTTLKII